MEITMTIEKKEPPKKSDNEPPKKGDQVGNCLYCGEPLYRKRNNGRLPKFCSPLHRAKHWNEQNRKDEANE